LRSARGASSSLLSLGIGASAGRLVSALGGVVLLISAGIGVVVELLGVLSVGNAAVGEVEATLLVSLIDDGVDAALVLLSSVGVVAAAAASAASTSDVRVRLPEHAASEAASAIESRVSDAFMVRSPVEAGR